MAFFEDPDAPTETFDARTQAPLSATPPLKPGERFPGDTATWGPGGPPPGVGAAPTSGAAPTLDPKNPASVDAWLAYMGTQPGVDPSVARDPKYWRDKILSGELGPDPGYIESKTRIMPGSGGQSGGGTLGQMGGGMGGDLLNPYTDRFSAPSPGDDPGFEWALGQGQKAIERSAASKGTLLTGGTLKDLAQFTTGAALQDYAGTYNRALNTFGTNYDIFRNNQNDPFNKLFNTTQLGLRGAEDYSNSLDKNTGFYERALDPAPSQGLGIDQGNINARRRISQGNTLQDYAAIGTNLANSFYRRPAQTL